MPRREGTALVDATNDPTANDELTPDMRNGAVATLEAPSSASTNGTAAGEGNEGETGASAASEGATPAKVKKEKRKPEDIGPKEIISLNVRVPNELRAMVAKSALERETSVPQLVAEMLAEAFEYKLPETARPARVIRPGLTPEQRKQENKKKAEKARNTTQAILAAAKSGLLGDIDIDALVAEYTAKKEAEKAAEEAAESSNTGGGGESSTTPEPVGATS